MNNEKVYIEGYVVGFMVDATGAREKQIQVSSGETVSIDESFIHKSITPEKVKIPRMVADWIDYCKENHLTITGAFDPVSEHGIGLAGTFKGKVYKCTRWALDNQNLFARAWLDGYKVEQEKRYEVSIKASGQYLARNKLKEIQFMYNGACSHFTRKELEEAGFGWVFSCEGVEVNEVK
ncbi:DUF1642 domain-containing protein [Streptococcus cristatus]|uniref:DUF1642 domain-containing protein n=1 Tax=Streptococcus cristatus TaxID=45634 RepID=UPI00069F4DCE|nr:DUF1642 domain-containing protein [Streptococcus cristatus]